MRAQKVPKAAWNEPEWGRRLISGGLPFLALEVFGRCVSSGAPSSLGELYACPVFPFSLVLYYFLRECENAQSKTVIIFKLQTPPITVLCQDNYSPC